MLTPATLSANDGGLYYHITIVQFLTVIDITTPRTFKFNILLDGSCNAAEKGPTPRARAVDSLRHFYKELCSDCRPQGCCCEKKNLTCYMKYDGNAEDLYLFTACLNNGTSDLSNTYLASFTVEPIDNTGRCSGETDFSRPGNDTLHNTSCAKQFNGEASRQSRASASTSNSNDSNKTKIIGGAIGGVLAALAALLPLGYYMYRRLKRRSEVDDTNNSAANLFGATPVVGFEEAPNSVAPAGTELKIIGGAIGGVLAAIAALLPLGYYMYRRIKRRSEVDDTNNSAANLFGDTPVVGFEEAPNYVAPAGTG